MSLKTLPALAPPQPPSGPSDKVGGAFEDDEIKELADRIAKLSNKERLDLAQYVEKEVS